MISPEDARAARHESGHWVVATKLGFEAGYISTSKTSYGAQILLEQPIPEGKSPRPYIENRVKVLFAGCAAQELKPDGTVDQQKAKKFLDDPKTVQDKTKTVELLAILGNMNPDSAFAAVVKSISDQLWLETIELVETEHEAIKALVLAVLGVSKGRRLERATIIKLPKIADLMKRGISS